MTIEAIAIGFGLWAALSVAGCRALDAMRGCVVVYRLSGWRGSRARDIAGRSIRGMEGRLNHESL